MSNMSDFTGLDKAREMYGGGQPGYVPRSHNPKHNYHLAEQASTEHPSNTSNTSSPTPQLDRVTEELQKLVFGTSEMCPHVHADRVRAVTRDGRLIELQR